MAELLFACPPANRFYPIGQPFAILGVQLKPTAIKVGVPEF